MKCLRDTILTAAPAHRLLVVLTGTTTGPAAAVVMVLGTDPRFDLGHA